MLLFISSDTHPNPGSVDHALSAPVKSPGETDLYNAPTVLSCSGLSPADFRKISPEHSWTCPVCPSTSQTFPSSSQIVSQSSSSNTHKTQKSYSLKINRQNIPPL